MFFEIKGDYVMIRVGDIIPDVKTMHKDSAATNWYSTHELFKDKKILLIGLPGVFLVEYAATHLKAYDFYYSKIRDLGIDEVYFTSVDNCYVQNAYYKSENLSFLKNLPDPNGDWAKSIGMLEDMSKEGLGNCSHRYAMVIDNLIMKHCKYEDFTHNPMTCFQVSDADTMIKYLEIIQTNYERFNDDARDKVDVLGRNKISTVLS